VSNSSKASQPTARSHPSKASNPTNGSNPNSQNGSEAMVTIDQKLKIFNKIVIEKLNHEYEELIHKLDKKDEEAMKDYKQSLSERAHSYRKELIEKGETEKKLLISKTRLDNKKEILKVRAGLVEKTKKNVLEKAVDFVQGESYKEYLEMLIEELELDLFCENTIILRMIEEDFACHGDFAKKQLNKKCEKIDVIVENLDSEYVGGFMILDKSETFKLDCTIKTRIDEQSDLIGKRVNELLNRVGDDDV